MKNICVAYVLLIILSACGGKKTSSVSLNGEIKGLANDTLYIYGSDKLYNRMDTLIVKDGKFSATLSIDTLVSVRLLFKDGTEYPLFLNKGDNIEIKGLASSLSSLEVKGSIVNEEFTVFQQELKGLGKPSEKALEEKAEAFINSHQSSLASIYLLEKYFVQKPQPDFAMIKRLIENMAGVLKDRPYIDELLKDIEEGENVSVGRTASFFQLPNAKGKNISRADFKDKYLLVHFWASWDQQSNQENTALRRIYKKEKKNKSFALLGVSLDLDEKTWKETIRKDTLDWEQVCNFAGWETEVVKKFSIQALPANVLLNPSGRIEGKNLSEEAIEKKLAEIKEMEIKEAEVKRKKK